MSVGAAAAEAERADPETLVEGAMQRLRAVRLFAFFCAAVCLLAYTLTHFLFDQVYGASIPTPEAAYVTRWGADEYARGTYSFIGVGASGADYDRLRDPIDQQLFFAGEATNRVRVCFLNCSLTFLNIQMHPATVAGAFLSGLFAAGTIEDIDKMCAFIHSVCFRELLCGFVHQSLQSQARGCSSSACSGRVHCKAQGAPQWRRGRFSFFFFSRWRFDRFDLECRPELHSLPLLGLRSLVPVPSFRAHFCFFPPFLRAFTTRKRLKDAPV